MKKVFCLIIAIFLISNLSFAQEQYGHIRGKVTDSGKEPLPGVTVTLECPLYAARTRLSSSGGTFRFINLAPGTYSLKCELTGFKTHVQEEIIIRVGNNFEFPIALEPATLEEEVTVVATSPIIDTKITGTAFNVSEVILQDVPSARDPWVILQQTPGIMVTQENVGGSRSGAQSGWTSKGTVAGWFGNYNMDGVNITDMGAVGTSSRYYDFDSFEEIQIVTSGQDPSMKTGGVSINFVTRRGGNKFEFLGRFFFTNDKLQGDNRTQELIDLEYVGNRIEQITDYGFQVGGPIIKDKIWFWTGYGVQDNRRLTIDGYPQDYKLESFNIKTNFQLSRKDRVELAFVITDKSALGRGGGPFHPPETTVNQIGNGGPLLKLEYERMFSDTFLMTLKLAHSWLWFGFEPGGGKQVQAGYDYYTGMYSGSTDYSIEHRPSYNAQLDGNYFLESFLGGDHEFRFGIEYRLTPIRGDHEYPGGDIRKFYYNGRPFRAMIHRCLWDEKGDRFSFYLNDSYDRGRLTINLGIRVDRENSWVNELDVPAHPTAHEIMPAFTQKKLDAGVIFWTFSPRLGLTFDLTGDGKTILKANVASYGLWPRNVAGDLAVTENNVAYYNWVDLNGDDFATKDELVGYPYDGLVYYSGFDIFNPTATESPNEIDPNLKWALTNELLFGVEREIFADFSLGANVTFRKIHRWNWRVYFNRETGQKETEDEWIGPIQDSYTVDGQTYDYEYWYPTIHRFDLPNRILENWPDWHVNYTGLEVIATKRLSRRWMMNASFTIQTSKEYYGERGYIDPTNIKFYEGEEYYGDSRWMAKITFLYQLPWGFNIAGFANAREGYANWQFLRIYSPERAAKGLGGFVNVTVERYGETRQPNFYNLDLSLTKEFQLGDYGRISIQVDAFNLFNFSHTLARVGRLNSPSYGEITGILNPRVIRFGIRYRF